MIDPEKKPSKYKNVKTEVDGITFSSKKEASRYGELKLLQRAGEIDSLTLQPSYKICVPDMAGEDALICHYVADFRYWDRKRNAWVVEDVKGVRTAAYKIKKKLMAAIHGIAIREV